jgi:hypothetical protein
MTKKAYSIFAVIGAFLWSATVLLRETALMDYDIMQQFFWRVPNVGAAWAGMALPAILYSHIKKQEFNEKYIFFLCATVLLILLLSEIVHHLWLGANFDIWDMVASIVAVTIFVLTRFCLQRFRK